MRIHRVFIVAFATLTMARPLCAQPSAAVLVIRHVSVVDAEHGRILPTRTVVVRVRRIVAVDAKRRGAPNRSGASPTS